MMILAVWVKRVAWWSGACRELCGGQGREGVVGAQVCVWWWWGLVCGQGNGGDGGGVQFCLALKTALHSVELYLIQRPHMTEQDIIGKFVSVSFFITDTV